MSEHTDKHMTHLFMTLYTDKCYSNAYDVNDLEFGKQQGTGKRRWSVFKSANVWFTKGKEKVFEKFAKKGCILDIGKGIFVCKIDGFVFVQLNFCKNLKCLIVFLHQVKILLFVYKNMKF